MANKQNKKQYGQFQGVSEFQMLEPRLFLSTTVLFRQGGGTGYTDTMFDDATLTGTSDTADGSGANIVLRNSTGANYKVGLLAIKDLFTLLPKDSGQGTINITSAKIHLFRYQGSSSDTIYIDRMTTDWLPDSAGSSEADVTFLHRDKSANLHWAGGGDFSSSDYTTTNEVSGAWVNSYNEEKVFDITSILHDIYSTSANYGFVFRTNNSAGTDEFRSSENSLAYRPVLEITYDYVYDLTVTSGTGDGTYTSGTVVSVAADAPASGYAFDVWTGDTSGLADIHSASTTYTMSTADASITATYVQTSHTLTVNSGSGDGLYIPGATPTITADAAPTGKTFDVWTGDTAYVTNVSVTPTTVTMPGADVTVTATYKWINRALTVNYGTGDGTTYHYQEVVAVAADTPATGKHFEAWTGDTSGLADVNAAGTNYTMPNSDAAITATYDWTDYTLSVNSGTGDGMTYHYQSVNAVEADAPQSGYVFDVWTGDVGGLADIHSASTTYTMSASNAAITATYKLASLHTLTVNNGTGDGTYVTGTVVSIAAAPGSGNAFYVWSGADGTFGNVNNASTTFTMPDADVTIYANCSPNLSGSMKIQENGTPPDSSWINIPVDDAHLTGGGDTADGSSGNVMVRYGSGSTYQVVLLGMADLFTQLPRTKLDVGGISHSITINSATLHLCKYGGSATDVVSVNQIISNTWMTGAAGTNESDVTFKHRDKSANLHWASGGDFSASDYTTTGQADCTWAGSINTDEQFNVTTILSSIYSTGNNHGFVVRTTNTGGDEFRSSEHGTLAYHPYLEISYTYTDVPIPMHQLTTNGATSSGTGNNAPGCFWENQPVTITANTPASGKIFNMWYGDIGYHNGFTMLSRDCDAYQQKEDLTPGGTIEVGDKFNVMCNGETLTYTATGTTVDSVCRGIKALIDAASPGSVFYLMTTSLQTSNNIAYTLSLAAKTAGVGWPTMTLSTTESDGSAADGQTFSIYHRSANHTPPTSNIATSPSTYQMPAYDASVTSSYRDTTSPLDWWPIFDAFCQSNFGAENQSVTYDYVTAKFGSTTMAFQSGGAYNYVSENSSYLGFETDLPAKTHLEYGTTLSYGTDVYHTDRYNYEHGYNLSGLTNNTTYYYRLTATDERGNNIQTTGSFTTATPVESGRTVSYITTYDTNATWAFTAGTANTLYVLKTDITCNYGGIHVTASNVTIDLNGHTIIYDNATGAGVSPGPSAPAGINSYASAALAGTHIFNGIIKQGLGYHGSNVDGEGYNPIMLHGGSVDVRGMYVEYSGTHMSGIQGLYTSGVYQHNAVLDRGSWITNRQALFGALQIGSNCTVSYNLIMRARHCGIYGSGQSSDTIYNNEVYTDSSATNSSCIGTYYDTGWNIYNNRVFGTGYGLRGIAINSRTSGTTVTDNFINLAARDVDYRALEYGAQSSVYGMDCRWNNYDITTIGNYVVVTGQDKGQARDIFYASDLDNLSEGRQATHNIKYFNNVFKATYLNADSWKCAAVNITCNDACDGVQYYGADAYGRPIRQMYFSGNTIISNYCNVGFGACGENYVGGKYAYFGPYDSNNDGVYEYGGNTLVKDTSISHNYYTIKLDASGASVDMVGNVFYDNAYQNGASETSVLYTAGYHSAEFSIGWSLKINSPIGAVVNVYDAANPSVSIFTGTVGSAGQIYVNDSSGTPLLLAYKYYNGLITTSYSYNINSYYSGTNHWSNGLTLDELDEEITL